MKNILVVFVILLSYAGCTKIGKTLTIKGRVLNPVTGKGIAGAEVWLQRNKGFLPGGVKTIKKVTSDENGNYEMNKASLRYLTLVCSTGENYYDIGWYEDGAPMKGQYRTTVKKFKTQHWDYHAVPMFQYKLSVNNVSCFNANDSIIINQTNETGSFRGVDWPIVGCSGYQTAIDLVPQGKIYTNYRVVKNGVSTSYYEEFIVQPNILNVQTINY